jgi:AraC-like DNA-binding protein
VLALSKKYDVKSGEFRAMSGIGNVYEALNRNTEAADIFSRAAKLAREAGEIPVEINLLSGLVYMYEKMGNISEAYSVSKIQQYLSDSILALDKQVAVRNLEILYNTEKTARLNESTRSKLILLQSRVRMHWIILVIVLTFSVVLGFMVFRMYHLYKERDQAYQALIQKYKADIESGGIESIEKNEPASSFSQELESIDPDYQKLLMYLETEKPYLSPDLKFDQVTRTLKISRKQLNQVIYDHTGMNFNGFVNSFRIQEAVRLLADPERKHYKIETIAKESGFGSKANFYSVFTLVTGSKPSDYR